MTKSRQHGNKSTLILTHGDSDGVCSGAIAKSAYPEGDVYFTSPVGVLDDLNLADGYENVVICDIAVDERHCTELFKKLHEVASVSNLTYIDHHPLPEKCISADWLHHDLTVCASELTYKVLQKRLSRDMRRVAIYGAIGDYYDNSPSVKEWLRDWDKRSLFFQAGTLIQALIYSGRNYDFKRKLVLPLSHDKIPTAIPGVLKYAKEGADLEEQLRIHVKHEVKTLQNLAYVVDPNGYMSKSAIYAASYGQRDVGISAEFRHKRNVYDMSLRSRNSESVDLNRLLRRIAPSFGGSGGGHASAAGARIPKESFDAFLREFDKAIGVQKSRAANYDEI
ncbi:MAG: single-stranded-DNA-specific exonuclease [Methanolobus sp.]|jgi:RecJ-like exonuclease|uniref:Single-stranded DNA-specific exonuclease n=1 Tax=Methanolobus tindarius DSM 2278 TaxID=1090322 RepID=W9DUC4_METTI|nr:MULTISPECIES: DHHA1 domain-containing protein [Methanolobus]ETA69220.1 single-stranded DNA-specific exonuclease [Methanolobus tindarius DSM 2278]MDI3486005.1 single-stranded-DNA-specific exonuclease [Methanolobus sp.]MDK2831448.1 single-stranded-DNA-specific exonuclease [Methanolobus sp.]MDK2937915.1 single-stranded-DNA-specific exonuclease [Methanolobus sp.]